MTKIARQCLHLTFKIQIIKTFQHFIIYAILNIHRTLMYDATPIRKKGYKIMHTSEKLFSIGEVCTALGITRRMLLNYEELGLVAPDSKNGPNGNRFYTLDTMTQIRIIRMFQNYGLSLAEIKDYFSRNVDLPSIIRRLEELRDELDQNIAHLSAYVEDHPGKICKMMLPAQTIYCQTATCTSIAEKTEQLRNTALYALEHYGMDPGKRQYATEYTLEAPTEVTFCVTVPEESTGEGIVKLPPSHGIYLTHHGPYEEIRAVNEQLLSYAKEQGISHSGRFRNVYLEGPPQHKDNQLFITQVILLL